MTKLWSFTIWIFEMIGEAFGTALSMVIVAFFQYGPEPRSLWLHDIRMMVGVSIMALIEFAITGYLITTLLSALYLPRKNRLVYPSVSFALYMLHSTIFFWAVGNRPSNWDRHNFFLQLASASVAAAITFAGDTLRNSRFRQRSSDVV